MQPFKTLTHAFYRKNKLLYIAVMFLMLLSPIFRVIFSWSLGEILDIITLKKPNALETLMNLLYLMIGVGLLNFLIDLLPYRLKSRFIAKAMTQYKDQVFSRLSEKSISAFSTENTSRYLSVLNNDIASIEENYLNRSFLLVYEGVDFVISLIIMFWYSWELALAAIFLCSLPIVISVVMGKELTSREKAVSDQNERYMGSLKDLLTGFSVIKSFKAETQAKRLFHNASAKAETVKCRRRWWDGLLMAVGNFCGLIFQFGIFFIGAYLALRGQITAGAVLVTVNLCNGIMEPVRVVPQYWASRKAAKGLIEKQEELCAENTTKPGKTIQPKLETAITLQNVSFGYEADQLALRNLSAAFQAGKKYAIVGGSGSGKSTMLNLLMGASSDYTGSIAVDGQELREIDRRSLYELMSLIGQNVFLFDDTLENNITMFRKFPKEQVESAVERSGLGALVAEKGADYCCGENGGGLSGGERQRVSIARCLLRGAPVLLLDEATAALDNQTAYAVTDGILQLEGLTRIVVTHRLEQGLMEQYDEILVLQEGSLQEKGTFAQLMAQKGYFYSLFTLEGGHAESIRGEAPASL
ncbi:MAG: ABC transporter ATP-binding protein [Oscillospiraceae bacterium]|nr:ABC transporter ATP-binding protein [Oscillospiraceae bacterium]